MRVGEGHFATIAVEYAEQVIAGGVPACRMVRQAAERFLSDIDSPLWVYRAPRVEGVCRFAQMLPHTKGRSDLLVLEPWQVFILANLFGLLDHNGVRKHQEAFLLIPRKNGKSMLAAVIALYMAFVDGEPGAEVWVGANSYDQAEACFGPCRKMAAQTPAFLEAYGVTVAAKSIFRSSDGSFVKAMIAKPGDGSNPHCAILDEAHENDNSDQYDTMKTGMGARAQPLIVTITTAGFNLAGPCRQRQLDAEAVLNGTVSNGRLFSLIYTIDEGDDWQDFEVWKKANPNYGVSVTERSLRSQYEDALNKPSERASLITKHLNVWQNSAAAWISPKDWAACRSETTLASLKGKQAWLAADLATQTDIAALCLLVMHDGMPHFFPFLFLPRGAVQKSKNAGAYAEWIDAGHLIVTEGNGLDFDVVEQQIRDLLCDFDVRGYAYDAYQGHHLAQRLGQDTSVPIARFQQNVSQFNPVMQKFESLVRDHKIRHPDNPALNWMAANISVRPNNRNLLFPNKPDGQDHLKIDGIVAALMAMGLQMAEPEQAAPPQLFFI